MSDRALALVDPPEPVQPDEQAEDAKEPVDRGRDLLGKRGNTPFRRYLEELFQRIARGFQNQAERSDHLEDYWNTYFCRLDGNQKYNGNAQIYVPIVRDAVRARATRFANHLFPQSNRLVEVVSHEPQLPVDIISLLDFYIRKQKVKTRVLKTISRNGDIEGQYNLYMDWGEVSRQIVSRETHGPQLAMPQGQIVELEDDEFEDIKEEDIIDFSPIAEVLHDCDVLILPATADTVEEALEAGGCVVIVRRWSKTKIDKMIAAEEIGEQEGKELKEAMSGQANSSKNIEKKLNELVGIQPKGEEATVWEIWHKLKLSDKGGFSEKDGTARLCRIWAGPGGEGTTAAALGAKRNPYWNDRCPLLTEPVEKVAGQSKGQSLVAPIVSLQYEANDAANEGADSAHYAALPIITADPSKVTAPLILNLSAVWQVEPGAVRIEQFPDLTPRAITRIQAATQAIFQALSVNPAMLPQQTGVPGRKRNQAEIALEQSVDIMMTSEEVSTLEEMLTDTVSWWVDLDHQFRDRPLTVRLFGQMGVMAQLEEIPVIQNRTRFEVRWGGAQIAKNASQIQNQIAGLNVLKGMEGQLKQEGYQLKVAPLVERMAIATYGADLSSMLLVDMRHQLSIDPQIENEMLAEGHAVMVQPMDDDQQHIMKHQADPMVMANPAGPLHILKHMASMKIKAMAQMMQQAQAAMQGQQQPGRPGGGGPRPGAQPTAPRMMQRPPGMTRPDAMPAAGAVTMPRRM